ncbi:hypothetical protein [Rhizobium leguminosarum]|uniref:hypothetical protein n=1 Tax=Rhizobium leguminosarum TaxID=384 RepID=UPI000E0FD25F|nr:hypothetical protein [Rhizobium leguminosarum]TBZ36842.1 hypothetical protein E0H44_29730 [Rhizobium leguminosarum bv. viciae]MBY5465993.1 hypothetical protein [Rhizobium leguminosarum]TCA04883.1 hypothetical protein E0H68_33140 [Rhizobium leguminosarum bv. viciae]TCA16653.1 hypothetical protein E0H67_32475 [Rhizobium leguminosarum bv. viciae]WHO84196.1 hypothetical protein QMO81_007145 [Rhizobium leguminosarum]
MAQAAIMQHIIMPPQFIIIGMPLDIIRLQHSMNMSLSMPSIGFISQTMPSAVMVHFIEPIIIIIGMEAIIGIIAPFIMGMPDIIGIIPPIIGFIMAGIMLFIIGIMFMAGFIVSLRSIQRRFAFQ